MMFQEFLAESLGWLAAPWFAISWYAISLAGVIWVIYDVRTANSALNPPLKATWPIIIFFFSAIGIVLYLITSRPRDIANYSGKAKMERLTEYSKPAWRKIIASSTHCVGGDGLGIMSAMVFARLWNFEFWTEFWFEYLVGYLFGWFMFQTWAMRLRDNSWPMSLWKGFRAEFFSMISVMVGMGLIMRFVTPVVVSAQPKPDTFAFWTFAAFGLMVGFILTYPVNQWLVAIGWKHGQGHEYKLKKMAQEEKQNTSAQAPRGAQQAAAQ